MDDRSTNISLKFRKAFSQEMNKGLLLLHEAATWLKNNSINYWQNWLDPPIEHIAWIKQGFDNDEFHFVENEKNEIVGMFRLQLEDEIFWGQRNEKAGYIHSFTTNRSLKGNNLGYSIMRLIEQSLLEQDIHLLRLDCSPDVERLCKYYENFGFVPQCIVTVLNEKLQLYEKKIEVETKYSK